MKLITAQAVEKFFATQWVKTYGPPICIFPDNGNQFTSRFFQETCRICEVAKPFSTTYHQLDSGKVQQFNKTILQGLIHYVVDRLTDWDLYTGMITYTYNTQVNFSTACSSFELVLSRPSQSLVTAPVPRETHRQKHSTFTGENNGYIT